MADDLAKTTTEWGDYLTVRDKAAQIAGQTAGKTMLTPSVAGAAIDAAKGGAGAITNRTAGQLALDAYRRFSTPAGLAMNRLGRAPIGAVGDAYLRQAWTQDEAPNQGNPWSLLKKRLDDPTQNHGGE
jgi:hypothetical protein